VGAVVLSECDVWIAALVSNGVVAPEHVDTDESEDSAPADMPDADLE